MNCNCTAPGYSRSQSNEFQSVLIFFDCPLFTSWNPIITNTSENICEIIVVVAWNLSLWTGFPTKRSKKNSTSLTNGFEFLIDFIMFVPAGCFRCVSHVMIIIFGLLLLLKIVIPFCSQQYYKIKKQSSHFWSGSGRVWKEFCCIITKIPFFVHKMYLRKTAKSNFKKMEFVI